MSKRQFRKQSLTVLLLIAILGCGGGPGASRPNIILIVIETLRADHLSCYGYHRPTTPAIDRIARQSLVFTQAFSACPWTNPTIASFYTGRYPQSIFPPAIWQQAIAQKLPQELPILPEILQRAGYSTIALIDHPTVHQRLKYDRGFDEFINFYPEKSNREDAQRFFADGKPKEIPVHEFADIFAEKMRDKSMFMYLHVMYPHNPYRPPEPYNRMFTKLPDLRLPAHEKIKFLKIALYDGEVRRSDELIDRIWETLKERGLLQNTYVIITADHGEEFGEHGFWRHGQTLYQEALHVPLVIYSPRQRQPLRIDHPVSTVDLFATIMDMAGISKFSNGDGTSLLGFGSSWPVIKSRETLFSQSPHYSQKYRILSVFHNWFKLIYDPDNNENNEFYDLRRDPREKHNLAAQATSPQLRDVYQDMIQKILEHHKRNQEFRDNLTQEFQEIPDEVYQHFRSLGYAQGP